MPGEITFHLDENVDPDIAEGLRTHGIDATVTKEENLRGASDPTQFDYAQRSERVLITHDSDFLRIAAKTTEHCGIVFAKSEGYSIGKIVMGCISLYHQFSAEDMRSRVEYL
jgi:predicted nuclease of predicted toxin-antitoxin system